MKRLREPWQRRDGTTAHPCLKRRAPLPPAYFQPSYMPFALESEDVAALRTVKNARRRDKKAGRSPRKWP